MSNIYIQEPPTNGKVLLVTSVGDIDVELWSKEAPKACRNFVQLCMENYYNNTIFHRIVKGFIIQGGDPTGTGQGGKSIYGKPFKDEFHQRLRFNRRGLVGMANAGPDDNGSQFFFTLDRADELNKKHTIFAKVGGNTIYNMIRMADLEVDGDDRPLQPPKIFKTEILYNPFDDIEAREVKKNEDSHKKPEQEKKKKKTPKNFKLLSFGEEAEEDDVESSEISKKLSIKSSHDALNDPKLSSESAVTTTTAQTDEETSVSQRVRDKLTKVEKSRKRDHNSDSDNEEEEKNKRRKQLKDEARRIKRELVEQKKQKDEVAITEKEDDVSPKKKDREENDLMRQLKEERLQFVRKNKESKILKKGENREKETLALLSRFQEELFVNQEEEPKEANAEDDNDKGWMNHALQFEDSEAARAKDANIKNEDTYEIFDPRNPITQRRIEASRQKKKEKRR